MDWIKNKTLRTHWFGAFPRIGLFLLLGLLTSICTFLLSLMVGSYFDLQLAGLSGKGILLEKFGIKINQTHHLFSAMGVILALKILGQYIERKGINQDADRFITKLQQRLFRRQMRWSPQLFASRPYSKYLLKYSGDLQPIRNLLVHGIHRGIRDLLYLLIGVGILFGINPLWSVILLGTGILIFPIFYLIDRAQLRLIPDKRTKKNELLHLVTDSFAKHRSLHLNLRVNRTLRKFNAQSDELLAVNQNYHHLESLRHALVNGTGSILIIILLMSLSWQSAEMSGGTLFAYLLVLGTLVAPIRNVIKAPEIIEKGMLSLKKIERTLRKKDLPKPEISGGESTPIVPLEWPSQKISHQKLPPRSLADQKKP